MNIKSILGGAALSALLATSAAANDPVKAGFVYIGPIGDFGWSYEHNVARIAVEKELGDDVETTYVESVPEGVDAERIMTHMALTGHDIIFATSFGYMDPTMNVAAKFPNVRFEHATGYKRANNVSTYSARFYEGRAVVGHIAGKMTESNKIGYIASFPIPEVIRGINSTYLHAKAANPDVEMKVVWVFSWFDPAKEADAAQALIDQGVDVLMQHTDSTAPMSKAEDAGIFAFGQASNQIKFGPNAQLTAIIDNWAPYYVERVKAVRDGTWENIAAWNGIKDGMVAFADFSDKIPADVQAEAKQMMADIEAGTYHPFTGPINKQDGSPWLADGEIADDSTLAGMGFYVEGIEGTIPN